MNRKGKILVVDDNPKNIQILGNILNDNNYHVEIALGGKEALEWLKEESFDLMLLDIMMPEINGFEVCQTIRQNPKFDIMPIIYLSAKNDKASAVHGFKMGGQDFIPKPFDTSELLARVGTHIELKKSREQIIRTNTLLEEKVLQRTLELEKSNIKLKALTQTKDKFLSFIGKEITSPLNDINNVVNLIKHSAESPRLSEMINLLERSVINLDLIVRMASQITKINNKEIQEYQEFYINGIIEHLLISHDELIENKNIIPHCYVDADITIKGNKELIKNSIHGILDTIFRHIAHDSCINIHVNKVQDQTELVINFSPPGWDLADTETMPEETLLYFSYADIVMDFHDGSFKVRQVQKDCISFIWKF